MLSKRSSDARALNREMATQFPNESWIQSTRTGSGVVVAVARPKHHPVVAQGNRPAIAVGGDVANGQNCHGVAGSRMDESTLPIYRNATETLMDCLTTLKI